MSQLSSLQNAIDLAGGQTSLARLIGMPEKIGQKRFWWYLNRADGKVPGDIAIKIERALDGKVTKEQLRPDLFTEDAE